MGLCATSIKARSPGCTGIAKLTKAERCDHPVFTFERDGVGDGCDRDQLQERRDQGAFQPLPFGIVAQAARRMAWASLKATAAPHSDLKG